MYTLWLSEKVFSMRFLRGDFKRPERDLIRPAYTEWEHAEIRLQGPADIFDRKDALGALNRAVLHRIRALDGHYQFRAIPGVDSTLKNTELLRILGLARGSVLDLIRQLRNRVEHELHEPPNRELCNLYLDAVWYFLRSTDSFLVEIAEDIYTDPGNDPEMAVLISPPVWKIYIEGLVADAPVSFLQTADTDHAYPMKIDYIFCDKNELSSYLRKIANSTGYLYYDQGGNVRFFGEIKDPECIRRFAQKYFSTF